MVAIVFLKTDRQCKLWNRNNTKTTVCLNTFCFIIQQVPKSALTLSVGQQKWHVTHIANISAKHNTDFWIASAKDVTGRSTTDKASKRFSLDGALYALQCFEQKKVQPACKNLFQLSQKFSSAGPYTTCPNSAKRRPLKQTEYYILLTAFFLGQPG